MPDDIAALISAEAATIKAEIDALLVTVKGRHPTRAQISKAKELRARAKALDSGTEQLLLRYLSLEMAVRERLGRVDVDGETITAADGSRADELLAGLRLC